MMADEFGGEIPVGPFALIGDDSIGRGIVETLRAPLARRADAQPRAFTIGTDARAAVKAAVMVEDVARTVHIARQLGEPVPIAQADVDSLYDRYQNVYGQPRQAAEEQPVHDRQRGLVPHREPGSLRRRGHRPGRRQRR